MYKTKKLIIGIAITFLIAGLFLLLFPTVSNIIGTQTALSLISQFDEELLNIRDGTYKDALEDDVINDKGYPLDDTKTSDTQLLFRADLERLYADSIEYNDNLKSNQRSLLTNSLSYTQPSLNLTDYGIFNGIYGYISAPTINLKLPIYLGANDNTMSYGAAHLTYTSLPLGGNSTNTVLAGHTGYIGQIFFDNLRKLQIGDEIEIKNYWSTLEYKVNKTEIHKPNDVKDIYISDGQDLLTLITCISDGKGGFDRLYVICERN